MNVPYYCTIDRDLRIVEISPDLKKILPTQTTLTMSYLDEYVSGNDIRTFVKTVLKALGGDQQQQSIAFQLSPNDTLRTKCTFLPQESSLSKGVNKVRVEMQILK